MLPQNENQQHQQARDTTGPFHVGRRRFLGYVVAAPRSWPPPSSASAAPAAAVVPSGPQPAEIYDLNDMLTEPPGRPPT